MRIKILLPVFIAAGLLFFGSKLLFSQAQELDPPCPSNILAVAHHVGGWEDETRWLTPTWEGGAWIYSSTVPASLTVPHLGKQDWIDYWNNGELRISSGTISVTQASYTCVAPDWDVTPQPPATPEPGIPMREPCTENCPICPDSVQIVSDAVGGDASQWLTPTWSGGSWTFANSSVTTLTVPQLGELDWIEWWNGKPVSITAGTISTTEASYTCWPPTLLDLPTDEIEPITRTSSSLVIPFLTVPMPDQIQSAYSCFASNEAAAQHLGGNYWNWTPPVETEPWGAWVFSSQTPAQLCVPPFGGQLDNWSFGSITFGCFPQPVQDASYHCPE